ELRFAPRRGRHTVPATRLEGDRRDSAGRRDDLRTTGEGDRQRAARRRPGVRVEFLPDRDSVSSRSRRGRHRGLCAYGRRRLLSQRQTLATETRGRTLRMTDVLTEDAQSASPAESPLLLTSGASIDAFCDALWLEHGLARNTPDAYPRDLRPLSEWLPPPRDASLDIASEADLTAYSAARAGDKSTSANRRLSVFRRYYAWAVREHRASADPTLRIRSAKQPPRFPSTLTEAQVEALLG